MYMQGMLTVMLAAAPAFASAATSFPLSFEHGDWQLVCDNTRTCRAAGYTAEDVEQSASVLITRNAGAGQHMTVQLQVADAGEGPAPSGALRLRLGGVDKGVLTSAKGESGIYSLTRDQADALLHTVTRVGPITVVDGQGQQWQVSDKGANAALLKMDDAQGRVGTSGALLRKGSKSEAGVLPPLPAPVIRKAVIAATTDADRALAQSAALLAAVQAALKPLKEECWRDDEDVLTADDLEVHRLSGDTLLVSAPCWMAAYNSANAYWTMPDTAPYRLSLVTTVANDYGNGELSGAHKGRGLGDCWSHESWVWDGKQFVASTMFETGLCRGQPGGFWELPSLVSDMEPGSTAN